MKEKLFVLTALVILSSITGIFFNMPLSISAQQFTMNDSTNTGDNEISVLSGDKKHKDKKHDDKDFKKFVCHDTGIVVDKKVNCPKVCPDNTDFAGHLVVAHGSMIGVACNDGDNVNFEVCAEGTDLEGVLVQDVEDCNIFFTCPGQDQQTDIPNPNFFLAGAKVTDPKLCQAATPAVQCGPETDLEGVWVAPGKTGSCTIDNGDGIADAECLKCADLATFQAQGEAPEERVAEALIGNSTDNVFTVCESEPVTEAFDELIDDIPNNEVNQGNKNDVKASFATCITNAEGTTDA
ncbi:MAG: hypothetical protein R3321_13970, partial [Nitrososphaeraceae archaeon]|nr:hypothetical protein [Nitrososphaeraceae archaeon]